MTNPYLSRAADSLELMAKELRTLATEPAPPSEIRHLLAMVESQEKNLVAHHARIWNLEQLNIADRLKRLEKDPLRTDDLGARLSAFELDFERRMAVLEKALGCAK